MLKFLEFKFTLADVSVFIHFCGMIVALYVDDMLFFSKDLKEMKCVKNEVKKLHIMKDLRAVSKILEIHMTHKTDSSIKINQAHYIQQVLAEFDMKHSKCAPVPLSPSINLKNEISKLLNEDNHKLYRQMID